MEDGKWQQFEELININHYVTPSGIFKLTVKMYIDTIIDGPFEQDHMVTFKHEYTANLPELNITEPEQLNKLLEKHLEKIKHAFKSKLEEILETKSLDGNTVEFILTEDGNVDYVLRGKRGKEFKFKEIKPSKG